MHLYICLHLWYLPSGPALGLGHRLGPLLEGGPRFWAKIDTLKKKKGDIEKKREI